MGGDMNAVWLKDDRSSDVGLTRADEEYKSWARSIGLGPLDTERRQDPRQRTYESRSTVKTGGHMGATSRIDDWLVDGLGKTEEIIGTPETHPDLPHTSDHHPLTLKTDVRSLGIEVDRGWQSRHTRNKREIKRMKKHLTDEDKQGIREAMERDTREGIGDCMSGIRLITEGAVDDTKDKLEEVAKGIHEVLKAGLRVALEEGGEDVTFSDRMEEGNGPGRRRNQKGHLDERDKRRYKKLTSLHTKLRAAMRKIPKTGEGPREEPKEVKGLREEMAGIRADGAGNGAGNGEQQTEDENWGDEVIRWTRTVRQENRRILLEHDKKQKWKRVRHFRNMLMTRPKQAHMYLFERNENHSLNGVRTATGEVVTNEEDVLEHVERHFRCTPRCDTCYRATAKTTS